MVERLTQKTINTTIAKYGTQAAAFYQLCKIGYLPAEIAVYIGYKNDIRSTVSTYAASRNLPLPATCAPSRPYVKSPPPDDWKAAFKSRVMRTGMVLHLTQPMLEFLCATADGVMWDRAQYHQEGLAGAMPDNRLATGGSLAKRGLIKHKGSKGPHDDTFWELTPAGNAVIELLKVAGIFQSADAALKKASK